MALWIDSTSAPELVSISRGKVAAWRDTDGSLYVADFESDAVWRVVRR